MCPFRRKEQSTVVSFSKNSLFSTAPESVLLCSMLPSSGVNGTLQYSEESGVAASWRVLSTIDEGSFSYSCLSLLPQAGDGHAGAGGAGGDGDGGRGGSRGGVKSGGAAGATGVNSTHVAVLYEGHNGLLLLARPRVV